MLNIIKTNENTNENIALIKSKINYNIENLINIKNNLKINNQI